MLAQHLQIGCPNLNRNEKNTSPGKYHQKRMFFFSREDRRATRELFFRLPNLLS